MVLVMIEFHCHKKIVRKFCEMFVSNIHKKWNTLKSSLLFKENTNFPGEQLDNPKSYECGTFRILFLNELDHIGRFSNLR